MARMARVVVPGLPHHVVQRGNRCQEMFFQDDDYRAYIEMMAEWCGACGVAVWAYCLMPNHVHLIVVPETEEGLARAVGEVHRRYSRRVNGRQGWTGHLWQGRFSSFVMDERHLLAAARYVELNPVRAGITARPEDYPWSSARAHLSGQDDRLAMAGPLLEMVGDWRGFLEGGLDDKDLETLRRHERTGRPLGDGDFLAGLEDRLGRILRKRKPGPRPGVEEI